MLAAALLLAACSMLSSGLLDEDPHQPLACRSQAGAYYLPKTFLKLTIVQDGALSPPVYRIRGAGMTLQVRADSRHPFCLDYLGSITSNDTVLISKTEQLLAKISTEAEDKSAEIAKNLISALFAGLSNNPDFSQTLRGGGPRFVVDDVRFDGEFDPFDKVETAKLNYAIKDFGFCILVQYEDAPIDPTSHKVQHYCDEPLSFFHAGKVEPRGARNANTYTDEVHNYLRHRHWHDGRHEEAVGPKPYSNGIFYRPRLPHSVFLYTKKNPKAREGWQLAGSETALFENRAPVIRVAVDRTYFAKRQTTLDFDKGVLKDIKITKDSELAGFVAVPLQIAQSIAALPANIIQIKIKNTSNLNEVLKAQESLIAARKELARLEGQRNTLDTGGQFRSSINRSSGWPTEVVPAGGGDRSSLQEPAPRIATSAALAQCTAQCMSNGGFEAVCTKICNCKATCGYGNDASCEETCRRED